MYVRLYAYMCVSHRMSIECRTSTLALLAGDMLKVFLRALDYVAIVGVNAFRKSC